MNLDTLLRDTGYQEALRLHSKEILNFETGTGLHGNTQAEVVQDVGELDDDDIWTFGGWSSSFDLLVEQAYKRLVGGNTRSIDFAAFQNQVAPLSEEAGARWMTPESAMNVIARVRPKAGTLAKVQASKDTH